ncbi:kinase-like domain-containing protein [Massariosphaeria phaeospora]|uniref:non-specific serine/threonine protein kinase n=1 Tax=Massariosphaeria phaeospora TaxID=100035 RepID=A0A7C8ME48_9PLEO|nr:kinase-like domain-containing protein [Massariosphaeria phaeospora]
MEVDRSKLPSCEGEVHDAELIKDYYGPERSAPVHIGDEFYNGKYRIVDKLGVGSYATVWLAKNTKTDVGVCIKIFSAKASKLTQELQVMQQLAACRKPDHPGYKHVVRMLDHFYHTSKNGEHLCLVIERLGPSIDRVNALYQGEHFNNRGRPNDWRTHFMDLSQTRNVCRQLLLAVDYIHSCGVVNGDIHSRNVLFRFSDKPEYYSDSKVLHRVSGVDMMIGEFKGCTGEEAENDDQEKRITLMPEAWKITWTANQPPEGTVPDYVVSPQTYHDSEIRGLDQIVLADFSNAFLVSDPPKTTSTITPHSSPELIFGRLMTKAIDIWSLACTTYEIVIGHYLWNTYFGNFKSLIPMIHGNLGESSAHPLLSGITEAISEKRWTEWPKMEDWDPEEDTLEEVVPYYYFIRARNPENREKDEKALLVLTKYLRKMFVIEADERPLTKALLTDEWIQEQMDS